MELVLDAKEEEGARYRDGDVEASSRGLLFMTTQTVLGIYIFVLSGNGFLPFDHVFARDCDVSITGR